MLKKQYIWAVVVIRHIDNVHSVATQYFEPYDKHCVLQYDWLVGWKLKSLHPNKMDNAIKSFD